MPAHVYGFDDEEVVTQDGTVSVDGVKVSGSQSFVRDLRLSDPDRARPGASRSEQVHLSKDEKWCYVCGHTRPKSYFSPKTDMWDGLDPRCKECENRRKRMRYQVSVNRDVRSYQHHEKTPT